MSRMGKATTISLFKWKDTPGNGVWKKEVIFCFFHLFDIHTFLSLYSLNSLFEI